MSVPSVTRRRLSALLAKARDFVADTILPPRGGQPSIGL